VASPPPGPPPGRPQPAPRRCGPRRMPQWRGPELCGDQARPRRSWVTVAWPLLVGFGSSGLGAGGGDAVSRDRAQEAVPNPRRPTCEPPRRVAPRTIAGGHAPPRQPGAPAVDPRARAAPAPEPVPPTPEPEPPPAAPSTRGRLPPAPPEDGRTRVELLRACRERRCRRSATARDQGCFYRCRADSMDRYRHGRSRTGVGTVSSCRWAEGRLHRRQLHRERVHEGRSCGRASREIPTMSKRRITLPRDRPQLKVEAPDERGAPAEVGRGADLGLMPA
jgi:hypothetical protein